MVYRKWIAVGLGVLAVVGLSLWGMWQLLDVRERTQQYLLQVMSSATQGGLSAKTIKMTRGAIELGEVRASASGVELEVGRATISYHLLKLLSSGFDPKAGIYEVTLHRPHAMFSWPEKDAPHAPVLLPLAKQGMAGIKVRLLDGTVSVRKGETTWSPDCVLSGWFEGREEGGIAIRLEGHAGKAGGKLLLEGTIEDARGADGLKITGTAMDLERWGKTPLSDLGIRKATLDLKGNLSKEEQKWRLSGEWALSEGVLDLAPKWGPVQSVSMRGTFADRALTIAEGSGVLMGQTFRCSGSLRPFDPSPIQLELLFSEVNIGQMGRSFLTEESLCPTGVGALNLSLFGPTNHLSLRGGWTSQTISYGKMTFEGFSGAFHADADRLVVDEMMARIGGGSVRGKGHLALDSTKVFSATLAVDSVDVVSVQRLLGTEAHLGGRVNAVLRASGTMPHPDWRAEVNLIQPSWTGRQWPDLHLEIRGRERGFSFAGENREIAGKGIFSWAGRGHLEAEGRIESGAFPALAEAGIPLKGQIRVEGPLSSLQVEGALHTSGDRLDGTVVFSGVHTGPLPTKRAEDADPPVKNAQAMLGDLSRNLGTFKGTFSSRGLKIGALKTALDGDLTVEDELLRLACATQDGHLVLRGERARYRQADGEQQPLPPPTPSIWEGLRGTVVVRDFPLSDALDAVRIKRRNGTGLLNGQVSVDGLDGSATLRMTDGLLEGVSGLEGKLAFDWDKQVITIREGFLRTREETLFALEQLPEGGIRAKADAIHAASLLGLLDPRAKSIGGLLSYEVSLPAPPGILKAHFDIVGGHIKGIGFDRLEGRLSGLIGKPQAETPSAAPPEQVQNTPYGAFSVLRNLGGTLSAEATFEKSGTYKGQISGKLPLRSTEEMDLSAHAQGDILALLSPLTKMIRQASGQGSVDVRLTGGWKTPALEEFEIDLDDGALRATMLTDQISGLKGKVIFDPEGQYVRIEDVSGRLDGDPFWIKSLREKEVDGEQMAPLIWNRLGVHFGILAVGTGERGVELAIPGLMRANEKGRLQFLGKAEGESFYIGGPAKTPRLRGKIKVRNGEITYPFLPPKSGSDAQDAFKQALKSVSWDLDVLTGEDVWYFRDAELASGGVHLKLVEGDVLGFHGIVFRKTFWLDGELRATEGTVSYLDTEFKVEKAGLEFDTRYGGKPLLRFLAKTTVYDDSTKAATDIFLEAYQRDERTGSRLEQARWGDFELNLRSGDPKDDSREKILSKLGYVEGEYERRAWAGLTMGVESYLLRPLLNPMERQLRRALGLDVVHFQPSIARNLLQRQESLALDQTASDLALFRGTQWTLGQYVARDWYLFYSGQLEIGRDLYKKETWGVKHRFGVEFRTGNNTIFQFEYDYDVLLKEKDRRVRVQHWFPF
ncbi:MAG: hypothetical protein V1800_14480 [Candidatus Latescibacterota bacterium]